jgi:hypothetical protein
MVLTCESPLNHPGIILENPLKIGGMSEQMEEDESEICGRLPR